MWQMFKDFLKLFGFICLMFTVHFGAWHLKYIT